MTAREIRKLSGNYFDDEDIKSTEEGLTRLNFTLFEICAQLAEMNDHARKIIMVTTGPLIEVIQGREQAHEEEVHAEKKDSR